MEKNLPAITPEYVETITQIPAFKEAIKSVVDQAVANSKPNLVIDPTYLSEDDARYLNREVATESSSPVVAKLESLLPKNEDVKVRPFGAIVKDLNAEHSFEWTPLVKTVKQPETQDSFKKGKKREATDEAKVVSLIDELAAKVSLDKSVLEAEGTEAKNKARFEILTQLHDKNGLSEDDVYAVALKSEYIDGELAKALERLATPIEGSNIDDKTNTDDKNVPADASGNLKSAEELEAERLALEAEQLAQAKAEKQAKMQEKMQELEGLLKDKRNALAKMTVQMRGRYQDNHDDEMTKEYNKALKEYRAVFNMSATHAMDMFVQSGVEDESTLIQHVQMGVVIEHNEFTKAEVAAYDTLNPKISKAAKGWSKLGLVKRTLASMGSGALASTAFGATFAVFGVPAVIAGGALLSVKAAKSIGMYKLNKAKATINQFQGNAVHDNLVLNANLATKEGAYNATEHLHNVIESRVKADQKQNRKLLGLVAGGTVVGAVLGATVGDWVFDKIHGGGGGKGTGLAGSRSGSTLPNTGPTSNPLESSTTTTTVKPLVPRAETPGSTSRIPASTDRVPNIPKPEVGSMPPVVTPEVIDTAPMQLHVPQGEGFENSIQQQFGLNDVQSRAAYEAMRPYLADQANTYMVNGDIRISSPGDMMLNQQASDALRHFLDTLEDEEMLPANA